VERVSTPDLCGERENADLLDFTSILPKKSPSLSPVLKAISLGTSSSFSLSEREAFVFDRLSLCIDLTIKDQA